MIERAFIHVAGPPGAGKTTLIERLLQKDLALSLVVRGERGRVAQMKESAAKVDPELRRFRAAGAVAATRLAFPASIDEFAFFETGIMESYSEAVFFEGDCPVQHVDLSVFVAPAPVEGETLLRREVRTHEGEYSAQLASWKEITSSKDAYARHVADLLKKEFGRERTVEDLARGGHLDKTWNEISKFMAKFETSGPPALTEHWALGERYEGLQHGQLVVVNVRPGEDRYRAEALRQEVPRLRKDEVVHSDILGIMASRTPVMAVVADLANPRDAGTRKAIDRVKRTIRRVREDR